MGRSTTTHPPNLFLLLLYHPQIINSDTHWNNYWQGNFLSWFKNKNLQKNWFWHHRDWPSLNLILQYLAQLCYNYVLRHLSGEAFIIRTFPSAEKAQRSLPEREGRFSMTYCRVLSYLRLIKLLLLILLCKLALWLFFEVLPCSLNWMF